MSHSGFWKKPTNPPTPATEGCPHQHQHRGLRVKSRLWLLVLVAVILLGAFLRRHSFRRSTRAVSGDKTGLNTMNFRSASFVPSPLPPTSKWLLEQKGDTAQLPTSERQLEIDHETIHVAYTACGIPNETEEDMFGLLSLKSLLLARAHNAFFSSSSSSQSRKYMFHVISYNTPLGELLNTTHINYDVSRAIEAEPLHLSMRVYSLDELDAAVRNAGRNANPDAVPHTVFKPCAASRLKLPFALLGTDVKRIIYLDWDTVVTCDLQRLWSLFGAWNSSQYLGFALNDPTAQSEKDIYREWALPRHPLGAVSSGVMMLDLEKMYANKGEVLYSFWNHLVSAIESRVPNATTADYWVLTHAFPLGDQDVLNIVLAELPEILFLLPPEYNWCLADLIPFSRLQETGFKRPIPCIHHFCGQRLFQDMMMQEGSPDTSYAKHLYQYVKLTPLNVYPVKEPPGVWMPPEGGEDGGIPVEEQLDRGAM